MFVFSYPKTLSNLRIGPDAFQFNPSFPGREGSVKFEVKLVWPASNWGLGYHFFGGMDLAWTCWGMDMGMVCSEFTNNQVHVPRLGLKRRCPWLLFCFCVHSSLLFYILSFYSLFLNSFRTSSSVSCDDYHADCKLIWIERKMPKMYMLLLEENSSTESAS
jgi:hypothetical protein